MIERDTFKSAVPVRRTRCCRALCQGNVWHPQAILADLAALAGCYEHQRFLNDARIAPRDR